jgi:hypothetical protein
VIRAKLNRRGPRADFLTPQARLAESVWPSAFHPPLADGPKESVAAEGAAEQRTSSPAARGILARTLGTIGMSKALALVSGDDSRPTNREFSRSILDSEGESRSIHQKSLLPSHSRKDPATKPTHSGPNGRLSSGLTWPAAGLSVSHGYVRHDRNWPL